MLLVFDNTNVKRVKRGKGEGNVVSHAICPPPRGKGGHLSSLGTQGRLGSVGMRGKAQKRARRRETLSTTMLMRQMMKGESCDMIATREESKGAAGGVGKHFSTPANSRRLDSATNSVSYLNDSPLGTPKEDTYHRPPFMKTGSLLPS